MHSYCRLTHFHELYLSNTHTVNFHKYTNAHLQKRTHDRLLGHISLCWVFKSIKLFTHIELISNSLHSIKPELTVKTARSIPSQFTWNIPAHTWGLLTVSHVYLTNALESFKKNKGLTINSARSVYSVHPPLSSFWSYFISVYHHCSVLSFKGHWGL